MSRPYRKTEAWIAHQQSRKFVDRDALIVKHYLAPHSLRETGRAWGLSIETIRRIIRASGNKCHAPFGRGCRPRSVS